MVDLRREREFHVQACPGSAGTVEEDPAAERLHPVLEPGQARSPGEAGGTGAEHPGEHLVVVERRQRQHRWRPRVGAQPGRTARITLLRRELAMELPLETTWQQLARICVQKGGISCYED